MDPLRRGNKGKIQFFKRNNKELHTHEEIKEKTEEFLKRGGSITKIKGVDSIIDLDDLQRRQDSVHGSDEKWWLVKRAIKPN